MLLEVTRKKLPAIFRNRRLSFSEELGKHLKGFEFDPGPWQRLRGDVWLSYVLTKTNWSWEELKRRVGKDRSRSYLVDQWRKGEVTPGPGSARKLEKEVPGSFELFSNPAWWLLRDYPVSAREVQKSIASYIPKNKGFDFYAYQFPELLSPTDKLQRKVPFHEDDSMMLYLRGDIHAFALILALVRKAEAERRDEMHMIHIADLYRSLPTLGRLPYIRPHFHLVRQMVDALRGRLLYTDLMVGVDWPLIAEQMVSDRFYHGYVRIPRDEMTPKNRIHCDPVTEGQIIPAERIPWPIEDTDDEVQDYE
ncbi:hypothetical protein [Eudoraea sp.]|uniref:hypothetical protein n=1 Tax=Eudoraea sp. TaxID=1979955 RepID=UPI003C70C210